LHFIRSDSIARRREYKGRRIACERVNNDGRPFHSHRPAWIGQDYNNSASCADGFATADEEATDVIAAWQQQGIDEPWTYPSFVDAVVETQRHRQVNLGNSARIQFYDRSPICTLALVEWLGHPVSDALRFELARIRRERVYRPEVFIVRSLGFVTPTEARRISLADSIRFGELHEGAYLAHGFKLIHIDSGPAVQGRVD
jgi:predicted ATPase